MPCREQPRSMWPRVAAAALSVVIARGALAEPGRTPSNQTPSNQSPSNQQKAASKPKGAPACRGCRPRPSPQQVKKSREAAERAARELAARNTPAFNSPMVLRMGETAPKLSSDSWALGTPVGAFDPSRVYVVSFVASHCRASEKALPTLARLSRDHPTVTFVCVASQERPVSSVRTPERQGSDDGPPPPGDQDAAARGLKAFFAEAAPEFKGSVAIDAERRTWRDWMSASGQSRMPRSFLVDAQGKVAWSGHPAALESKLGKASDQAALHGVTVKHRD